MWAGLFEIKKMNKKDLIVSVPINSLSFGNVSINLLREMFKRDLNISLFPIGDVDISTFDKLSQDFISWINKSINTRFQGLCKDTPTFKLWHLRGSESRISSKQYLYTFHEMDLATNVESELCKFQDATIFSSSFSKSVFEKSGCDNVVNIPIGFDEDFYNTNKNYLQNVKVFGISGKFEKRKHTEKVIKLWISKYGGNMNYRLHCLVNNPFIPQQEMQSIVQDIFQGQMVDNVTFFNPQKDNSMMNNWLNSVDIDLSGLSGAEGWNLGAFNSTCLGKWSIVLNHTSHSDWATPENSILIEPNGKDPAFDGRFFNPDDAFNQGSINTFDDNVVLEAFERSEFLAKTENKKGVELGKEMTYSKTLDQILKVMEL